MNLSGILTVGVTDAAVLAESPCYTVTDGCLSVSGRREFSPVGRQKCSLSLSAMQKNVPQQLAGCKDAWLTFNPEPSI